MNVSVVDKAAVRKREPKPPDLPDEGLRLAATEKKSRQSQLDKEIEQKLNTLATNLEPAGELPPEDDISLSWLGKINWAKYKAIAMYWFWSVPVKAVFGFIYITVVSDGFANLTPVFAMRLSRMPGLGFLEHSETFYTLNISIVLSAFLFIVVTYCWNAVFRLWIFGERKGFETKDKKYAGRFEPLIVTLSVVVVIAELLLFYLAINDSTWGSEVFSFTALLASVAFVGVLLGVILIGIHLEKNVSKFGESK